MDSSVDREIVQAIYKTVSDTVRDVPTSEDRKIVVIIFRNDEESTDTEQKLEFYGFLLKDVVGSFPTLNSLPPFSYPTFVVVNATGRSGVSVGTMVIPSLFCIFFRTTTVQVTSFLRFLWIGRRRDRREGYAYLLQDQQDERC